MKFNWNELYNIGIDQIDDQHKKLISLFQDLCDSMGSHNTNEKLEDLFMELAKYANYHFETEEELFERYQYPDSEYHIEKHREFIQALLLLYHDFNGNRNDLPHKLYHFLYEWINKHILGTDQEFGTFLKNS